MDTMKKYRMPNNLTQITINGITIPLNQEANMLILQYDDVSIGIYQQRVVDHPETGKIDGVAQNFGHNVRKIGIEYKENLMQFLRENEFVEII
ncbi:MAG: hypothetical protein V1648_00850 [Candidatus Aenigmatarchaeota archaeon]